MSNTQSHILVVRKTPPPLDSDLAACQLFTDRPKYRADILSEPPSSSPASKAALIYSEVSVIFTVNSNIQWWSAILLKTFEQ